MLVKMMPSQTNVPTMNAISPNTLYTVIWTEFSIATIAILLRVYSQLFVVRRPSADDWIMIGAWICQTVASILATFSTLWGLGSDLSSLNEEQITNSLKYSIISMPFGVLSPMLGRISFSLFLIVAVMTVYPWRRRLLWGLIVTQSIVNIIPIILEFTQCKPVSSLWNPFALRDTCSSAWVVQRYGYFQGTFNAMTDLCLILMGLAVVITLKLKLYKKIVLCLVLSLSTLALVATILKTTQLHALEEVILKASKHEVLDTYDFSYANAMWTIWFLTEGAVVIVTASAPRMRAILVLHRRGKNPPGNPSLGYGPGPTLSGYSRHKPSQDVKISSSQLQPQPQRKSGSGSRSSPLWPSFPHLQWAGPRHGGDECSSDSRDGILVEQRITWHSHTYGHGHASGEGYELSSSP